MQFDYNGETHDLFDIIDKEADFLGAEDNDDNLNIILKQGIIKLSNHFGFKDHNWTVEEIKDTNTWGTVIIVKLIMIRPPNEESVNEGGIIRSSEKLEDRLFCGDGEVNKFNFTSVKVCFPMAVALKRARSRAVLLELGVPAFGEDESEGFQSYRKSPKKQFTAKSNAQPTPEAPKVPKAPPSNQLDNIRKQYKELILFAEENNVSKEKLIVVIKDLLSIKSYPGPDDFLDNPDIFIRARKAIRTMEGAK